MPLSEEEEKARRRAYYEARTPEQRAVYKAQAAEWRAQRRAAHIAVRAAAGLKPHCTLPERSPEEIREMNRAKAAEWRAKNLERSRENERIRARKAALRKAEAEGRQVDADLCRPKAALLTEDEKRERRRVKSAKWRAENIEQSREIARESAKRIAAEKAVAAGREPGKGGAVKRFTEEELRAKRKAKAEAWNAAHGDEVREKAKLRERAKRAGTFVSRALPRLTDEERRLVNVAMAANRRARGRGASGRYTRDDILRLLADQKGHCAICNEPFGPDGYHIDHWKPLSRGGTNDAANLKLTHPACNLKKGARLPDDFVSDDVLLDDAAD